MVSYVNYLILDAMSFSVSRKDSDDENFTFKNLVFKDSNEPKILGLL